MESALFLTFDNESIRYFFSDLLENAFHFLFAFTFAVCIFVYIVFFKRFNRCQTAETRIILFKNIFARQNLNFVNSPEPFDF